MSSERAPLVFKAAALKLQPASDPPEGVLQHRLLGFTPRGFDSMGLGKAQESAFLTSSP